jgi:hypothetical protein
VSTDTRLKCGSCNLEFGPLTLHSETSVGLSLSERGYSESDQGFVDRFGGFGRWVLAMRVGAEDQGYDAAY